MKLIGVDLVVIVALLVIGAVMVVGILCGAIK